MVVDTSALAAILFREAERPVFRSLIAASEPRLLSAASLVETSIVMEAKLGSRGAVLLDALLRGLGLEVVALDRDQAEIARSAFRSFGRGRHPAGLNFGDCFSYALAKATGEPLLFKGDDFTRTDVTAAWTA
jgi:ribonuclease VapC